MSNAGLIVLLVIAVIWELVWKSVGLWRAGRNNQLGWFIFILILNTAGILEIIYLMFFQKDENFPKNEVVFESSAATIVEQPEVETNIVEEPEKPKRSKKYNTTKKKTSKKNRPSKSKSKTKSTKTSNSKNNQAKSKRTKPSA